jgi:hypothetical protein
MIKLREEDPDKIERLVTEFEDTQFGEVSEYELPKVLAMASKLRGLFRAYNGNPEITRNHERFLESFRRAQVFIEFPNRTTINYEARRDYGGISRNSNLRVKGCSSYIFLQTARKKVRMSWRFNMEGRVDSIDAMSLREGYETCNLIESRDYKQEPFDWNFGVVRFSEIPSEVGNSFPVCHQVGGEEDYQRYLELTRLGHSYATLLLSNLKSGNVGDYLRPVEKQKPLLEIKDDSGFMNILTKAARLIPYMQAAGEDRGFVFYKPLEMRSKDAQNIRRMAA